MTLHFAVSSDHSLVGGREHIVFRPDLPISQLVFRLTANTAPTVATGTRITITSATADHGAGAFTFTRAAAAASTQGGLLHIPFASRLPAGTVVTANIAFRLTLGGHSFDRFGRSGRFAYFGSAEPLLAWQRGYGWHTEPMTDLPAETTTSEAMNVSLAVRAPAADTVIMSGDPADPRATSAGTRTWRARIPTARDVSVATGPFVTAGRTIGSTRLRVGAPNRDEARRVLTNYAAVMRELSTRFGPYPFASLSVARFSTMGGGIEYPSSILAFNSARSLAAHETAHQWFYGMVGNSQALHPWLDEAFANYAERLLDGDTHIDPADLDYPTPVDQSVAQFGTSTGDYIETVYQKGSSELLAARRAAGAQAWDAAVRCYVAENAWRIAVPADFATAISQLPRATRVLRAAGAIP